MRTAECNNTILIFSKTAQLVIADIGMGSLTLFTLIVVSFTLFCELSAGPGDSEKWDKIPSNHQLAIDANRAALFASTQVPDVSFERVSHPTQGAVSICLYDF